MFDHCKYCLLFRNKYIKIILLPNSIRSVDRLIKEKYHSTKTFANFGQLSPFSKIRLDINETTFFLVLLLEKSKTEKIQINCLGTM